MERTTKLVVLSWACLALAAQSWLLENAWPGLVWLALLVFVIAAASSAYDRSTVGIVLLLAYVYPVLVRTFHGSYTGAFAVLWTGALLGAIAPDALRTPWHLPARWRGPLVCWTFVIVASATVVVLREMDFYPATLFRRHVATSSTGGGGPAFVATWTLRLAFELILGILWFDWLFGARLNFVEAVAAPLGVSATVLAAVAVYQASGHIFFLNETIYGGLGRASGTVFDANVCGTLAALWMGGAFVATDSMKRWRFPIRVAALALGWLAVWATGSRTGLGGAVLVTAFIGVAAWQQNRDWRSELTTRRIAIGGVVAVAVVLMLTAVDFKVPGPLPRLMASMPDWSFDSVRELLVSLWARDRYGTTATAIIQAFPWFGIGIGFFFSLVSDYAVLISGLGLPPDNAQNWFRHQLAEFGFVGSLPWIAWVVLFAIFVLKRRPGAPPVLWIARGMLVAFAAISLVGMPSQFGMVGVTFWTVAFWYVSLAGAPERGAALGRRTWMAIAAIVIVFTAGTVYEANTRLRPVFRAQAMGWPYSYGFYLPEEGPANVERRWTERRAVTVVKASKPWMELTVSASYRNVSARSVDAKVWRDGELVIDTKLVDATPVTKYVPVLHERQSVVIETWVSRTMRPRDLGIADDRELGLLVSWRFVEAPATGNGGDR